MPLPSKAINEFIEIYEKKTGKKIDVAEAEEMADRLYSFVKTIYDIDCRLRTDTKEKISKAIETLYQIEKELIQDEVHEQTISARLSFHLQSLFPDYVVDVEFNVQGENRDPKLDSEGRKRKPDIIIHKRGSTGINLAVILIKCEWNKKSRKEDKRVALSLKEKHKYHYAFVLDINKDNYLLTCL